MSTETTHAKLRAAARRSPSRLALDGLFALGIAVLTLAAGYTNAASPAVLSAPCLKAGETQLGTAMSGGTSPGLLPGGVVVAGPNGGPAALGQTVLACLPDVTGANLEWRYLTYVPPCNGANQALQFDGLRFSCVQLASVAPSGGTGWGGGGSGGGGPNLLFPTDTMTSCGPGAEPACSPTDGQLVSCQSTVAGNSCSWTDQNSDGDNTTYECTGGPSGSPPTFSGCS